MTNHSYLGILLLVLAGAAIVPELTATLTMIGGALMVVVNLSRQTFYAYQIRKLGDDSLSPEEALCQYGILVSMQKFHLARSLRTYHWPHYIPNPEERSAADASPYWRGVLLGEAGVLFGAILSWTTANEPALFLTAGAVIPLAGGLLVALLYIGHYRLIAWRKPREQLIEFARKMDAGSRKSEPAGKDISI